MHLRMSQALKADGNVYELPDIIAAIHRGDMQGFVSGDTWIVTQITDYPRKKTLDLLYIAGDMAGMAVLYPQIEAFAVEHGCALIRGGGRDGWLRVGAPYGWRDMGRIYHKDVEL